VEGNALARNARAMGTFSNATITGR
jgi:hypothetical protein